MTPSKLRPWRIQLSLPAAALYIAATFLAGASPTASAQAVPPAAVWSNGSTLPEDQPLAGQMLGTDLSLNQGVSAINAENESFHRYGFGFSASGGAETNFLGTQTDQLTAGYAQFAADGGIFLENNRTIYYVLYQPSYNVYPQFPDINSFGQTFYQAFAHALSERAGISWSTTAARYLSVDQFLPQGLGIGSVGVVVPTLGSVLRQDSFQVTNAATSIKFRYLLSPRLTFVGSLTSGFFLLVPADVQTTTGGFSERLITSGADLRLDYQWTPRDAVGVQVTPIYIYGLRPSGRVTIETVEGVYQRQFTPTLTARVGAGPLFLQSSSSSFRGTNDVNYAVNASLSRQVRQSQFTVGYSRAILINLAEPALISNSFNFNAYIPLKRRWILTGAASYLREGGSGAYGAIQIYGGAVQTSYQITPRFQLFALYSLGSETFGSGSTLQGFGYTRNKVGGGIRFNLGHSTVSGGSQ